MSAPKAHLTEPAWVRRLLIAGALGFLGIFLVLPLVVVFAEAFRKGLEVWAKSVTDPIAWHAIRLSVVVTIVCVVCNGLFGVAAAWLVTRFRFAGKGLLLSLIDLPFAVSPVISGLIFVLLFGAQGLLGPWLEEHDLQVIFALPGILLATVFVTFPFVARELIPLMEAQGTEEEEAARVLGASGWTMFRRVTLPAIRWGLLYGCILCSARAMGEFGAVSVVSSHTRGQDTTLPLHIEMTYNEYQMPAAFACASLLSLLGLVTLGAKRAVEWHMNRTRSSSATTTP